MKTFARVLAALCCFLLGMSLVGGAPNNARSPITVEPSGKGSPRAQPVASRNADDDDDDEEEEPAPRSRTRPTPSAQTPPTRNDDLDIATRDASAMSTVPPRNPEREDKATRLAVGEVPGTPPMPARGRNIAQPIPADQADDGEDEDHREEEPADVADGSDPAATGDQNGPPPLPEKALPPSKRNPRMASEPLGPPAPPQTWTAEQISAAKAVCARLINEAQFEFSDLKPIREGSCGAPAPISLAALRLEVKIEKEKPKEPEKQPEKDKDKSAQAGKTEAPQAQPVAAKRDQKTEQAKPEPDITHTAAIRKDDDDEEETDDTRDAAGKEKGKDQDRPDAKDAKDEPGTKELEVALRPAVTVTCPLADAMARWNREVVQPKAREHLKDDVVGFVNASAYQCRTRYNDPGERISYHAFAEAVDISGFMTAKGEQISVDQHWNGADPKAKFLQEVHAGACKIFGTVLGPRANAAHRNHFHLDMAKRRFSAFCQ